MALDLRFASILSFWEEIKVFSFLIGAVIFGFSLTAVLSEVIFLGNSPIKFLKVLQTFTINVYLLFSLFVLLTSTIALTLYLLFVWYGKP